MFHAPCALTRTASSRRVFPARLSGAHGLVRRPSPGRVLPWALGALALSAAAASWWAWGARGQDAVGGPQRTADGGGASRASGPGGPEGRDGRRGPGGSGRRFSGADRPQPVGVATVRRQDIDVTVGAIGNVAAANTAVVKPKIEGELRAIHFQEGQWIKAGTLLAEIDPRPYQIALAQAEGQLARDQAQLQNARLDLARFQDLLGKEGISRQQVDTQEALVKQLQGTVQADQAQADHARLQLSYTRIAAPIAGRAGLRQVDLGNVVRPSDAGGIVSISQTQPAHVVFAVPDGHLPALTGQLHQGHTLAVEAWDRERKVKLAEGRLTSTDNAIDASTGTIRLKALFANADDALFPNQAVNVRLRLRTVKDALVVPDTALLLGSEGHFLYALNADRTVSQRPVQAGVSDRGWVDVRGALKPGEQVVVDGTDRLRDGARVEVIDNTAGSSARVAAHP